MKCCSNSPRMKMSWQQNLLAKARSHPAASHLAAPLQQKSLACKVPPCAVVSTCINNKNRKWQQCRRNASISWIEWHSHIFNTHFPALSSFKDNTSTQIVGCAATGSPQVCQGVWSEPQSSLFCKVYVVQQLWLHREVALLKKKHMMVISICSFQ